MNNTYYLYRHVRCDKNEVFYIGIGLKNSETNIFKDQYPRAFRSYHRSTKKFKNGKRKVKKPIIINKHWNNIANKTSYKIDIIYETSDEKLIKFKEIEFIKLYGRHDKKTGTLVNHTDGGDGTLNPSQETIKKRTRYGKENSLSVCVYQYDLKGNYIKKFDSVTLAAKSIKSYHGGITKCVLGKIHYYKNSQWFYTYQGLKIKSTNKNGGRNQIKVGKYDKDSLKLLHIYNSLKNAALDNGLQGHTGICSCCKGRNKTAAGFIWKYII